MSVSLKKEPTARDLRWIAAAEAIAGSGTGWPGRFVALVAQAAEGGTVKTISLAHVQNISSGHRHVTDDLDRLIVALAPGALKRIELSAHTLQAHASAIGAELEAKNGG